MSNFKPLLIFIYGPTGVGKTDFTLELANHIPSEIINMDMGQFYTPLSIGTAKPDWRSFKTPHHLFDIIDRPENFSVAHYRKLVLDKVNEVWAKKKQPILVGGSGFYLKSLFFPPIAPSVNSGAFEHLNNEQLKNALHNVDAVRASNIHVSDRYRLLRALEIWQLTGKKPSEQAAQFNPPGQFILVNVTRDRAELYQRINQRTNLMLDAGWINEVCQLRNTPWWEFLQTKKIMGYDDIISYVSSDAQDPDQELLIATIAQKTRNYAKRQVTFWRMLEKQLATALAASSDPNIADSRLITFNLTLSDLDLYINQLIKMIKELQSPNKSVGVKE